MIRRNVILAIVGVMVIHGAIVLLNLERQSESANALTANEADHRAWCATFEVISCTVDPISSSTVEVGVTSIASAQLLIILDQSQEVAGWRLYGFSVSADQGERRLDLRMQFLRATD
jgi:hypothetical protein